jgi:hypothetical protein
MPPAPRSACRRPGGSGPHRRRPGPPLVAPVEEHQLWGPPWSCLLPHPWRVALEQWRYGLLIIRLWPCLRIRRAAVTRLLGQAPRASDHARRGASEPLYGTPASLPTEPSRSPPDPDQLPSLSPFTLQDTPNPCPRFSPPSDQSSSPPAHSQTGSDHPRAAHAHSQVTQPRSTLTSRPLPNDFAPVPNDLRPVPSRSRSLPNHSTSVPLPSPSSSKRFDLGPPPPHDEFQTIFGYSQITQPHIPSRVRSLPNHFR